MFGSPLERRARYKVRETFNYSQRDLEARMISQADPRHPTR